MHSSVSEILASTSLPPTALPYFRFAPKKNHQTHFDLNDYICYLRSTVLGLSIHPALAHGLKTLLASVSLRRPRISSRRCIPQGLIANEAAHDYIKRGIKLTLSVLYRSTT